MKHNIYILLHACSATVRLLHSWACRSRSLAFLIPRSFCAHTTFDTNHRFVLQDSKDCGFSVFRMNPINKCFFRTACARGWCATVCACKLQVLCASLSYWCTTMRHANAVWCFCSHSCDWKKNIHWMITELDLLQPVPWKMKKKENETRNGHRNAKRNPDRNHKLFI